MVCAQCARGIIHQQQFINSCQQPSTAIHQQPSTCHTQAQRRACEHSVSGLYALMKQLSLSLSLSDIRLRITIQKKSFFEISDTSAPHSRLYTNYRQRVVPNHRRVSASSSLSRASTTGGTSQVQQGLKKNSQKNTQTHTQQPTHPAPLADKCNLTLLPPALPPPVQYYTW